MSIGARQIVVMTNIAIHHPLALSSNQAVVKFASWPAQSKYFILDRLKSRGFIEDIGTDGYHHKWILTPRGWSILHKAKGAPIEVTEWDPNMRPLSLNIRKSLRPEFQVLYEDHPEEE